MSDDTISNVGDEHRTLVGDARQWADLLRKYASGENRVPMLRAADLLSEAASVIEKQDHVIDTLDDKLAEMDDALGRARMGDDW